MCILRFQANINSLRLIWNLQYHLISFTENSGSVLCFYCGIEVKEWKEGETAWGKHAKLSPNCVFVGNNEDREFIETERLKESDPEKVNLLNKLFLRQTTLKKMFPLFLIFRRLKYHTYRICILIHMSINSRFDNHLFQSVEFTLARRFIFKGGGGGLKGV